MALLCDVDTDCPKAPARIGLLCGQDLAVAAWTWTAFNRFPMFINRAFGLMEDGKLVGSIIFSNYNMFNVEFSYYARNAMTVGVLRTMARMALEELNVERVTFCIPRSRRRLGNQLKKFGAQVEGVLWCYYGRDRASKNAAMQYVMFKDTLMKLAGPRYARGKLH